MKINFAWMGLVLITGTSLAADHWPSWRGPTANGVAPASADPPIKWDEKTNILWKTELPGRGSATPIIWEDQIFIVTSIKTDRIAKPEELPMVEGKFERKTVAPKQFYRFEVISYDRLTGKERWRKTANEAVPHEGHHITHSYAAGSPTTDGKRLYVSFGSFGIYAYDLNGQQLWKREIGRMNTRLGWGEAVTPTIHGESLVLNWDQEAGSKVIVLDAATGKTQWEKPRDEKTSWNTPCVVEHNGITQVILNGTNRIRSYDLKNGDLIWDVAGMTTNAIPSPLVWNSNAFVMSGYRGAAAVSIPLDTKGSHGETEKLTWRYAKGTPYVPSPVLYEGRLYFTEGNTQLLTVLDAKTGKPLSESDRLPRVTSFYASPVAAAGRIYFVDRGGATVVLKAGDKPEAIAVNPLDDKIDASPAIVGKTLYLRGEKYLYAIGK